MEDEERLEAVQMTPGELLMQGLREGAAMNASTCPEAEMSSEEEEDEIFQSEAETTRGSGERYVHHYGEDSNCHPS